MDFKVRIWAVNYEFPEGKMYYPATMYTEVDKNREFYFNQYGDAIHGRYHPRGRITHTMVSARVEYSDVTKMLCSGVVRNEKEIYVLDIMEYSFGDGKRAGVVYFDEGCFRVDGFLLKDLPEDSLVIGNIKENPELVGMEELAWKQ